MSLTTSLVDRVAPIPRVLKVAVISGLVVLLGSQVMLMEAPSYWVMCLARILQGISSSVVWVMGLASSLL